MDIRAWLGLKDPHESRQVSLLKELEALAGKTGLITIAFVADNLYPFQAMNHKIADAIRYLEKIGISRGRIGPIFMRALWRIGINVPPPHFLSRREVFLLFLVAAVNIWGPGFFVVNHAIGGNISFLFAILGSAFFGIIMGAYSCRYYHHERVKHGIPVWNDFGK